jgi:GTP cyclohydrolase II
MPEAKHAVPRRERRRDGTASVTAGSARGASGSEILRRFVRSSLVPISALVFPRFELERRRKGFAIRALATASPPWEAPGLVPELTVSDKKPSPRKHIKLTSHPQGEAKFPILWGNPDPKRRGPIVATLTRPEERNAIGTHSGAYAVYRALAIAAGSLQAGHVSDLTNTSPTDAFGPHPQWGDPEKIVSIDPFGATIQNVFAEELAAGHDIRPTIAVTKAHLQMMEVRDAMSSKRLVPDGHVLKASGDVLVTKAAIEPVWWLPGIAKRFNCEEHDLRRTLFEQTGGMFPELVTRPDLDVFLPPIGGHTVYIFGDPQKIGKRAFSLTCRVHDECNGSDVFGSDICTCRPYLTHGIEECIKSAQEGGAGLIVYNRKEGRALGEVTKFLVYNARKRQEGGDSAAQYFARTECVAGVQDMRFQELMPDALHWLGIDRIDRFVSMSNMKHDALVRSGIEIGERVRIPDELIPADAKVEMDAKMAAGYYSAGEVVGSDRLESTKGRGLDV